jgi:enoyl-CoA hydratase/carnithine racemase
MNSPLEVTRNGRVAVLTLKRPEHGNRLSGELADAVTATLKIARTDAAIGACVITGAGEVFCLGGDYLGAGPSTAGRREYARALVDMDLAMARLGKPLIAAVNGDAHAGGFSVVIGCDFAVAAEDATAEARDLHVVNEVVLRTAVLDRAIELAKHAASHNPEVLSLGRDLYYRLRGVDPVEALKDARATLLAALTATDRN